MAVCAKCGAEIKSEKVYRADTCAQCGADLRCCLNCKFYEPSAYNQCREPQAERVVDKERANFCDFFSLKEESEDKKEKKENYLKELDNLFKKT
ncbi:MAG: hypothetical protein D6780_07790 [Candidatus Dadabacteria bacterium]|nr:MAG: hypothetical protein D6780_07790 [Candidatus Dadabacteria bacterium]